MKPITLSNCQRQITFISENGRRYVDEEESYCACRDYKFSKEYIGPIGNESEHDIDAEICRKMSGYDIDSYSRLINWLHEIQGDISKFLTD